MDNDDVSQESIVIFINELGMWVVRVTGNLGCDGRPKGWGLIAKLRKEKVLLVRFGCNLAQLLRDSP